MKFLFGFLVGFGCFLGTTQGQNPSDSLFSEKDLATLQSYEDSIDRLSNHLLYDTSATARFVACKFIIKNLVKALQAENSFHYTFPKLGRISIQYPEDSSFRIFTWQLFVNSDEYRYYGAIQLNSKNLQLIPLSDRSHQIPNPEKTITDNDQWFGALYYNIKTVESPKFGKYYLLFGYDANTFFTKRKLMDVLQFKDNKAVFGLPVFQIPPDILEEKRKAEAFNSRFPGNQLEEVKMPAPGETRTVSRFMINYSASATVRLNFDPEYDLILFDNLIQIMGEHKGQGMTNVPDGSYRGFQLQPDGTWLQIEKVFNDYQEEAPRPVPLLRKDIMIPPKQ